MKILIKILFCLPGILLFDLIPIFIFGKSLSVWYVEKRGGDIYELIPYYFTFTLFTITLITYLTI